MTKLIIAFFVFIALSLSNAWADPVVVIVNKDNPTASLSASDVQKYFLNKTKNWPSGGKVKPINRNDKSSVKKILFHPLLVCRFRIISSTGWV